MVSDFGYGILGRLREGSAARDPSNSFFRVFDGSVGEWLDHFDVNAFHEQLFLETATGKWLDLHGKQYGVPRHLDESDTDYRERIIKHVLGELTPKLLNVDFGLEVYANTTDFSIEDRVLTSDNPYITSEYIVFSDDETRRLVEKSFVINEEIEWFVQ